MAGQISVGNNTVRSVYVGEETVNRIYYGDTLIYLYVGNELIDSDGKYLLDSNENNLMCE